MKNLVLAIVIATTSLVFTPKKADAGVILIATAGASVGVPFAVIGGFTALPALGLLATDNKEAAKALAIGAAMMITLDADQAMSSREIYPNVPSYIFDEINEYAKAKRSDATKLENGLSEVVLTHDEVDSIFSLSSGGSSDGNFQELREALTTSRM